MNNKIGNWHIHGSVPIKLHKDFKQYKKVKHDYILLSVAAVGVLFGLALIMYIIQGL